MATMDTSMPQPNWKKPLILAAALFVIATFAYWAQFKHKPAEEAKEAAEKKIFTLKETPVKSVTIVDAKRTLEIDCVDASAKLCKPGDNSKWQISEPLKLKADDSNANSLVSTLNNLNVNEKIDLKDETPVKRAALLKEYGLSPEDLKAPTMRRVQVVTASGTTVLYLGQTHPVGEAIFSALEKVPAGQQASGHIDENTVYLVPAYFKSSLDHDLTYWRDKKLMAVAAHEIESFDLNSPKGHISGDRKNGEWVLHFKGEDYPGDIENIDSLLSGVAYLSAKDFTSNDKNDKAAKAVLKGMKPLVTMTVVKEKGSAKEAPAPVTLTLYSKPEKAEKKAAKPAGPPPASKAKIYATVSDADPLFELESFSGERFQKNLKDLRLAKLITSMERFTAKKLEFAGQPIGDEPLVLNNKDGKWESNPLKGLTPAQQDVDGAKVSDLLDKLTGNRIRDFLTGSAIPAGADTGLIFSVTTDKPEPVRKIAFWKKGGNLYARDLLSKRAEAFSVDSAIIAALPWDRSAFFKTGNKPK